MLVGPDGPISASAYLPPPPPPPLKLIDEHDPIRDFEHEIEDLQHDIE
jgi:hypothetical protein